MILKITLLCLFIVVYACSCKNIDKIIITEHNKKKVGNYNIITEYQYYLDSNNKIKNGFYTSKTTLNNDGDTILNNFQYHNYLNGKLDGMWLSIDTLQIIERKFDKGKLLFEFIYNKNNKKISQLKVNGEKNINGSMWGICYGLQGIRSNELLIFKNGKRIKTFECDKLGNKL